MPTKPLIKHKQPLTCEKMFEGMGWIGPGGLYADLGTPEAEQYTEIELRLPPDHHHLSWVTAHALEEGETVATLSDAATQAIVRTLEPHADLLALFWGED